MHLEIFRIASQHNSNTTGCPSDGHIGALKMLKAPFKPATHVRTIAVHYNLLRMILLCSQISQKNGLGACRIADRNESGHTDL